MKDIVSTLFNRPRTRILHTQSTHKTIATASATGFDTHEVYSSQPHQLSPLGSVLGSMEDANTSSLISVML